MKYKIKKGKNYHSNLLSRLWFLNFGKEMIRYVKISKGSWYDPSGEHMNFTNKLFGMSYYKPTDTSGRFGCRPSKLQTGLWDIYTFTHDCNTLKPFEYLGSVMEEQWFKGHIRKVKGRAHSGYGYTLITKGTENSRFIHVEYPKGWIKCFPFWGWTRWKIGAPKETIIEIKKHL